MRVYRHEIKILPWDNITELESQMNTMSNEDDGCKWRAENHKLSGTDSGGWTMYRRSWEENPPLLEAKVRASAVFNALNSASFRTLCGDNEELTHKISKYITDIIKEAVQKEN